MGPGCRPGGRQTNIHSSFSVSPSDFSLPSVPCLTLSFNIHLEVFIKQSLGDNTDVLFLNSHHIYRVLSDVCSMLPETHESLYLENRRHSCDQPPPPPLILCVLFLLPFTLGVLCFGEVRGDPIPLLSDLNKISLPFSKETICAFPGFADFLYFASSGMIVIMIQYKEFLLGNQKAQALVRVSLFPPMWLWTNHLTSALLFLQLTKRSVSPNHGASLDQCHDQIRST